MSVVRVRTQETIARFSVRELVLRAVEATRYPGTEPTAFHKELCRRIADHDLGVFVGVEEECPRALAVALLPTSTMMMAPQVTLVYSEGRPRLIREVSVRVRAWLGTEGYDRALGINLYRGDSVFMHGFSHFGAPRRVGSMIEFKFDKS